MYGDNKKIVIIIGSIVVVILLVIFLFLFLNRKDNSSLSENKKRENIIKLIKRYYEQDEYERAMKLIEDLLIENADDEEALNLQEKVLQAKKEKEEREKEELLKRESDTKKILESMTNIIEEKDEKPFIIRKKESEDNLNSISEVEKEKRKKINTLINEGIDEYNKQNYANAKDKFLKALELDDNNAEANAYLGATYFEEDPNNEKNVEEAVKKSKKALKIDNNIETAHYTLAQIYDKQGLNDLAIEEYKETIKINPNKYEAFYNLGRIYYKKKEYKLAEEQFLSATRVKSDYVNAYFYLGITRQRMNKINDAIASYKKCISIDPKFITAYANLGEIYRINGDYSSAIIYFQEVVKIEEKYKYYQKIGECYKNLNQFSKAIENYRLAIDKNGLSNENEKNDVIDSYKNIANEFKEFINGTKTIKTFDDTSGISTSGLSRIIFEYTATMKVKFYENKSKENLNDLFLKVDYPATFKFVDANPKPTSESNLWSLANVNSNQKGQIEITGSLVGQEGQNSNFKINILKNISGKKYSLVSKDYNITLSKSNLSLNVILNNDYNYIASPGETLFYVFKYKNNSNTPLENIVLKANFIGEMFDFQTAQTNGYFDSLTNTFVWNAASMPSLSLLSPGQSGEISLRIKLKDKFPISNENNKNFVLKVNATIESPTVPSDVSSEKTIASYEAENKVRGNVVIDAFGLYRDPVWKILNKGPYPPKVNQPTQYTIHWKIQNYANDISNVKISSFILPGTIYTGVFKSNIDIKPDYNKDSGLFSVSIPFIPANRGVINDPIEIVFQVENIPSINQIDKDITLLSQTKFEAQNEFTGENISLSMPEVKTDLINDPTIKVINRRVQP